MPVLSDLKKSLEKICLAGLVSLTSCTPGEFKVVRLNNAPTYDEVTSQEDIREVPFAYWNAADLRGDTPNLFEFISAATSQQRADSVGTYFREQGLGIIGLGEVDYDDTAKTGFRDQAIDIAAAMNSPYDYVVVDQYMVSRLFPWTTGNGMVLQYPAKVVHRHLFGEDEPFDSRLGHLFKDFIHVKIKVGKRELDVILSHLDDEDNLTFSRRRDELEKILAYAAKVKQENEHAYIAFMADANAVQDSSEMRRVLTHGLFHPPERNYGIPTHRSHNPTMGISHVFVTQNMEIQDYDRFCPQDNKGEYISDHCGVKGVFVFKD